MKIISTSGALEEFGIVPLTYETQYLLCHTVMSLPTGA